MMKNAKSYQMDARTISDANLECIAGGGEIGPFGNSKLRNKSKPKKRGAANAGETVIGQQLDEWDRARHPEKYMGGGFNRGPVWYPAG